MFHQESEQQQESLLTADVGVGATETRLLPAPLTCHWRRATAEVLRNLCYRIHEEQPSRWNDLVEQIKRMFKSELLSPVLITVRSEITMEYRENGINLTYRSAGRGLQQTLLLLAYMYANPGAVLLLDEPDAHLEILRQREIYHLLT